jgi:exodeoxyribonuclease VII large subunit
MIIAEINQLTVNRSGHAYLQLVEKDTKSDKIIANLRAVIWANKFLMISDYFQSVAGTEIKSGIKILFKAEVTFHQVYGLSLVIHDIDPAYTLGEFAKQKQEIIKQLEADGIIEMNKSLEMPLVPQRLAIISSPTAAGLGDFLEHINNNEFGYKFHYQLFEAIMQGEKTEQSIIAALDKIYEQQENFDVVAIIRGGGSKLDLSAFDAYNIAVNIAQFPLPVITGIGHQRDLSVADLVAHKSLKTPTAVADFLINRINEFDTEITDNYLKIKELINEKIFEKQQFLHNLYNSVKISTVNFLQNKENQLNLLQKQIEHSTMMFLQLRQEIINSKKREIKYSSKKFIERKENETLNINQKLISATQNLFNRKTVELKIISAKINAHNPQHILNLGYSITLKDGKTVTNAEQLKNGDTIVSILKNGKVKSIITEKPQKK